MAENDPWASWNPTANPVVKGNEAYQHRRALSRGLSADPGSPPVLGAGRSTTGTGRVQPVQASSGPSASGARKPLPEQSFPGSRSGSPNRSGPGGAAGGGGWQRSPPRGHIDRGWASKTGHFDPITKPEIVGDIASASNAPLTAVLAEEARAGRVERENKDKSKDNNRTRDRTADDRSRDADRVKRSAPSQSEREREREQRERERRRSRSRGRESNKDRNGDRKRPRTDDDDSDRRRTRPRSRSCSRSRDRDRDRRSERRDDRRDDRRNDRRDDGRDRRREDRDRPRDDKEARVANRSDTIDEKRKSPAEASQNRSPRPVKSSQDTRLPIVKPVVRQEEMSSSSGSSQSHAIVISGLLKGTTPTDVKTILKQYGHVEYCKEAISTGLPADKISFEAGFSNLKGAENAVKSLDGVVADGSTIQVKHVKSQAEDAEVSEPVKSPELKLKGFATSNPKDSSLLSRLGAPVPPAKTNGLARAAKANGSTANLPISLLRPYDDLLRRAGVTSLDKLGELVRPNSIKAYIEMLCKEYPNEEVLQGVTARWALKDRLEEWLGEKEPLQMDWTNNKASGENVKREEVEDGGIDLV